MGKNDPKESCVIQWTVSQLCEVELTLDNHLRALGASAKRCCSRELIELGLIQFFPLALN
jgi:hypothetical protein